MKPKDQQQNPKMLEPPADDSTSPDCTERSTYVTEWNESDEVAYDPTQE